MFHAIRLLRSAHRRIPAGAAMILVAAGVVTSVATAAEPPLMPFPAQPPIRPALPSAADPPVPPALPYETEPNSEAAPPAELVEEPSAKDPFSRPPGDLLRSLSTIRVELDSPTADTLGEAEFQKRGLVTLAPHAWPRCTPQAASYRFVSAPLWYEDANLERCGQSCGCCIQPLISGAYFFGNTATLPYRLVAESQCRTVPSKSFCPPGYRYSCVDNYFPEPDAGGGVAQAVAVTGLIFLIP